MKLNPETRIGDLLDKYPFLLEFLPTVSPKYKRLTNPIMRKTIGRIATIAKAANIGGFTTEELIAKIEGEINRKIMEEVHKPSAEPAPPTTEEEKQTRKEALRSIILDLHAGEDLETARKRFAKLIENIEPTEIVTLEQSLIDDGMDVSMLKKLSEVHIQIFKESLSEEDVPDMPPGHPINTYMQENRHTEKILENINSILQKLGDPPNENVFKETQNDIVSAVDELRKIDLHYTRKENQIFPVLETKGISGPSTVMWEVHDDIRALIKGTKASVEKGSVKETVEGLKNSSEKVADMIYKEEHILYPLCMENFSEEEWVKVKKGEEEIGYSWIKPGEGWSPDVKIEDIAEEPITAMGEMIDLDTGNLTKVQLNQILKLLPIDISFVNEKDRMAYYSDVPHRIFPRSPGIIGREVQKCHPPKSIDTVKLILKEFKEGTKDKADFWIQLDGRFLYIRYFPVRDPDGNYMGTLEVSQDLTELKKLEGEKRLLDWK
jgi:DUF438 domain-containing protein